MSRKRPNKPSAVPVPRHTPPREPCGRWQTQPLTLQRAESVRALAHAALEEQLGPQLAHLQSTSHVTAEKLERLVQDCVRGVGQVLLGKLLESEAWRAQSQEIARAACPTCGQMSPRARDAQNQPLCDTMTLETLVGPVPWGEPLYVCPTCRRAFSPCTRAV